MIPSPLRARTTALGRAAARRALDEALATLDAWYDESRIAVCAACLGVFVRPVHARQGGRIYCSSACRQLAYRMRQPSRPRTPRPALPLLDPVQEAALA